MERGFVKLPNHWWSKKQFVVAEKTSCALWLRALMFCADRLTDGIIQHWELSSLLGFDDEEIQQSLTDGLLIQADQGAYSLAFFLDISRPKAEILKESDAKKQRRVERARKGGFAKAAKQRAQASTLLCSACGLLASACVCTQNSELRTKNSHANAKKTRSAQDTRAHRWSEESLRIAEFALSDQAGYYDANGWVRPSDWLAGQFAKWQKENDGTVDDFEADLSRTPRLVDKYLP